MGKHAEVVRQWLLEERPGEPTLYGCLMFGLNLNGAAFTQIVMQPVATRVNAHRAYRFMFGGFLWVFLVSSREPDSLLSECVLKPDGSALFMVQRATALPDLASFAKELTRMGRNPVEP